MDHQLFAALFVTALIGQFLTTSAAPLSDSRPHHDRHQGGHHQGHHKTSGSGRLGGSTSVKEIENILRELDDDTTVLIADKDKVTEIYPEQRQLPAGTDHVDSVSSAQPSARRLRRSFRRRARRSAALLLHATLRMCDMRPLHCQSIMLQRDNVRVNIRLVDQ